MKTYFRRNSMSEKAKNLLLTIIPVVITGALCSYFSRTGVSGWYSKMATSTITPPNYIFSLAWSIIYICLILSVYRILASSDTNKAYALRLYWQQLILQVLWCVLFFGMQLPLIGGVIILWLVLTVFQMICAFWKIDKAAACLNIFYFCYICFASFLNWSFLYVNNLVTTY